MSVRLQKFLASAGLGSRRGCEALIEKGLVKINGKVAALGSTVTSDDRVEYQNKIIQSKDNPLKVIALNKHKYSYVLLSPITPTVFTGSKAA